MDAHGILTVRLSRKLLSDFLARSEDGRFRPRVMPEKAGVARAAEAGTASQPAPPEDRV